MCSCNEATAGFGIDESLHLSVQVFMTHVKLKITGLGTHLLGPTIAELLSFIVKKNYVLKRSITKCKNNNFLNIFSCDGEAAFF